MTTAPRRGRFVSLAVEGSLLAAAAAALAVVLLPAARRGRERSRRLEWADDVREGLGRSGAARHGFRRGPSAPREGLLRLDAVEPELASWGNIGGCGVGGGGGGDVRWMGRRAPGGFVEVECMVSYAAGEDLQTTNWNLKVSGDVPGRFNVGLQLPYLYSLRDEDVNFAITDPPAVVSSLGDLSLLVSRKFGMTGRTSANLTVGIPTAPYDLWHKGMFIPYDAQPGRGRWTFSLGAEHILERDYGPTIVGGSYSHNGGENDIGNYKADSIAGYYYFSYKTDTLVHSLGANLTFALGKDRDGMVGEMDAQAMALLSLQYGLEFMVTPRFPLFVSGVATVSEKRFESYTLALGVVTSF